MLLKLLVIDDEAGVLDMIRGHFELRGFDVATASDGLEGIELCRNFRPDIILLDLKMGRMDGDAAIPRLKQICPAAKIFVVSAYQDDIMRRKISGLNVDKHFEKPVSVLELEREIRAALAHLDPERISQVQQVERR